ncbi:MAG: alpha-E domain-containing protein [Oscillochloris sp.]|nr:alpha-E domain-containing protein [Oscillochloris sp.]
MLSRVADNLFWMSRYLERAEHTARVLGVGLNQMLDQTGQLAAPRWARLLTALAIPPGEEMGDPAVILRELVFNAENPASIVACIAMARENARQVREQISSEMWEQLNRLYLRVRKADFASIWAGDPAEFLQEVKEGAHLFQGVTDATMSHGEGWHFIEVGRYLERAVATSSLLDVYFHALLEPIPGEPPLEYNDWVSLLKCCTSFETYCKTYTADVQHRCVAEFLLLNAESPRSVRFAADRLQHGLNAIAQATGGRPGGRVERLAGRLRASLDYAQVDEIMNESLHSYLESVQRQCGAIHMAIYQTYISYPVDTVLS